MGFTALSYPVSRLYLCLQLLKELLSSEVLFISIDALKEELGSQMDFSWHYADSQRAEGQINLLLPCVSCIWG